MRDLRLDFFRGIALAFIFLNHIPGNIASKLSTRDYGFSDATEIFVYISGYTAVIAYGSVMRRSGLFVAGARILHRVWQLYVAHIFLFVVFTAQIAYVATRFDNPLFSEEMNIARFMNEPHVNLIQALLLKFKPSNMDVLPLYIALLFGFLPILFLLTRAPRLTLGISVVLYVLAIRFRWNLPGYPEGESWVFNPFCWQLLFVLGAWAGLRRDVMQRLAPYGRPLLILSIAYLVFALFVATSWRVVWLEGMVPPFLERWMYPISKPNVDILRLAHFFALAYLAMRLVGPESRMLQNPVARAFIQSGRHSLQVFCMGVFLSFTGHFILVEINGSNASQTVVSLGGLLLMWSVAVVLDWYKLASEKRSAAEAVRPPERAAGVSRDA